MSRKGTIAAWVALALPGSVVSGEAPPTSEVTIREEDGHRIIEANGIPDHDTGDFPNRGNPNRIREQSYRFRVALSPEPAREFTPIDRLLFGVGANGIPFDPGTAEFWHGDRRWRYEALSGKIDLGLDRHHAHVQPNGGYHYHGIPTGLVANGDEAIGWAADGFTIRGPRSCASADVARPVRPSYSLRTGVRPDGPGGAYDGTFVQDYEFVAGSGDLDEANGHAAPTPEHPEEGVYHYHLTEEFPFVPRFFRGTPDESFRRGPPPRGR